LTLGVKIFGKKARGLYFCVYKEKDRLKIGLSNGNFYGRLEKES
jgi:hypothetical protein